MPGTTSAMISSPAPSAHATQTPATDWGPEALLDAARERWGTNEKMPYGGKGWSYRNEFRPVSANPVRPFPSYVASGPAVTDFNKQASQLDSLLGDDGKHDARAIGEGFRRTIDAARAVQGELQAFAHNAGAREVGGTYAVGAIKREVLDVIDDVPERIEPSLELLQTYGRDAWMDARQPLQGALGDARAAVGQLLSHGYATGVVEYSSREYRHYD
jgi:hypothetical protein